MRIRGIFQIQQVRNGKIIREFTSDNAITKRGAIHFLGSFCPIDATPIQGNEVQFGSFATTVGTQPLSFRYIEEDGFVALSRDDAILYTDGVDATVQGDNRQWQDPFGGASTIADHLQFDDVPAKGATQAVATHQMRRFSSPQSIKGIWLEYKKIDEPAFNIHAVIASVEFTPVLELHSNDIVNVTYTLDVMAS